MPSEDPTSFTNPELECDVVMKGGVTSGIVYPRALCEIARKYRLRSVGGTSAGAIAAGMAAAAEVGRHQCGFDKLWKIPDWLERDDNLKDLFQPDKDTRPLFRLVMAWIGHGKLRALLETAWIAIRHFPVATLIGAAFGLGVLYLTMGDAITAAGAVPVLGGALHAGIGAALAFAVAVAYHSKKTLPRKSFGLCSGLRGTSKKKPLTEWIADELDDLAGVTDPATPLTCGNLNEAGVNLVTITTNLTHGAPYHVPFKGQQFYYDPDEFRKIFPPRIVSWMELPKNRRRPENDEQRARWNARLPKLPLPPPDKLPVVVAIRLSLSFPILLAAVPLWFVDHRNPTKPLQRTWFSDGGICSNFPVHFFDRPLPGRPTFGINLRPRDELASEPSDNVFLGSHTSGLLPRWTSFTGPVGFLAAVIDTMQSWSDNLILGYPGYRDRVAHIEHISSEGGLNLNMPAEVIARITERGRSAGVKLREEFDWATHKWTRYRSTMRVLEDYTRYFAAGYRLKDPVDERFDYAALIARKPNDPPKAYSRDWSSPMRAFATKITEGLLALSREWQSSEKSFDTKDAPDPKPVLRVAPDFMSAEEPSGPGGETAGA